MYGGLAQGLRALLLISGGALAGCADAIDNALEINGDRLMNVPLRLEGDWQGQIQTGGRVWVRCIDLRPQLAGEERAARLTLSVQGAAVRGTLEGPEGRPLAISGTASAGTWYTGINHAPFLYILADGDRIGSLTILPHGGSGNAWADGRFDWPAFEHGCRVEGVLVRVGDATVLPQQTASN